jgi:hypothetical protein
MLSKPQAIALLHKHQDASKCNFGFKELPEWMIEAVQEASQHNHISRTYYDYDTKTLGEKVSRIN